MIRYKKSCFGVQSYIAWEPDSVHNQSENPNMIMHYFFRLKLSNFDINPGLQKVSWFTSSLEAFQKRSIYLFPS